MLSLVVHGGAWQIPDEEVEAHREGLRAAMARGIALLQEGRPGIDVVVETIAMSGGRSDLRRGTRLRAEPRRPDRDGRIRDGRLDDARRVRRRASPTWRTRSASLGRSWTTAAR